MRQKRVVMGSVLAVLLIAFGLPCMMVYRELHQEQQNRALIAAIYRNDALAVVSLLKEGANANARDNHAPPPTLRQIIHQLFDRLKGKPNISEQPADHPALWVAVEDYYVKYASPELIPENTAIIQALLEHGADVKVQDENGDPVLKYALKLKHPTLVRLLLEHKADPNQRDTAGFPMLYVTPCGAPVILTQFLLDSGADPNARVKTEDFLGQTDLMGECRCSKDEDYETVRLLLARGADVNLQDKEGKTALMYAIEENNPASARLLLAHGANVALKDQQGQSALDQAKLLKQKDLIRLLKQAEAKH